MKTTPLKAILAVLVSATLAAAAAANPTHVGVPVADLVTLISNQAGDGCGSSPGWRFRRVQTDGVPESQSFDVPAGRLLLITDVLWTAAPLGATWGPDTSSLLLRLHEDSAGHDLVSMTTPIVDPASTPTVGGRLHLGTPVIWDGGAPLCASAHEAPAGGGAFALVRSARVMGYLIDPLAQQPSPLDVPAVGPGGLAILAIGILLGGWWLLRRARNGRLTEAG